jgi:hypothetical protein
MLLVLAYLCGMASEVETQRVDVQVVVAEGVAEAAKGFWRPDVVAEVLAGPVFGVAGAVGFGEAPESAPDTGLRSGLQQVVAVGIADQQHPGVFLGLVGFGFAVRVLGWFAAVVTLAVGLQRADAAGRFAAGAEGSSHVHHGLGVFALAVLRSQAFGNFPQVFLDGRQSGPALYGEEAGQHPFDVAVEDGGADVHADGGDGSGGGAAYTGQFGQLFDTTGKFATVLFCDYFGAGMQVASAGVVAEAGPEVQYFVLVGIGEGRNIREALHETFVIGDDGADLGLLQHDFGDPDPVGANVLLPWQVFAAVLVIPVEYAGGKCGVGHGWLQALRLSRVWYSRRKCSSWCMGNGRLNRYPWH